MKLEVILSDKGITYSARMAALHMNPGRDSLVNRTPSRGQRKNIKIIKEWVAAKAATHSLCSQRQLVLFHRRKDTEITLHTSGVVISDVVLNHLGQFLFACKPFAVISFPLQDTP